MVSSTVPSDKPIDTASAVGGRWLLWLLGLVLVAGGTWQSYWADQRNDQYQLINLGRCVADGGDMYVDCWENKPPGIAWINAGALKVAGGHALGAWIMPGVIAGLALIVMGLSLRGLVGPSAAAVSVFLGGAVIALRVYDSPSINPDGYSAYFELMAGSLWLAALAQDAKGIKPWLWGLLAGLFWAFALTVKVTGLVGFVAMTLVALLFPFIARRQDKAWWRGVGMAWFGWAVGIVLVGALLFQTDTLDAAWAAAIDFNRDAVSSTKLTALPQVLLMELRELDPLQFPLWLALLAIPATFANRLADSATRAAVVVLVIWWIVQAALVPLGPSGSMRYWQATFPPLLLLMALGLAYLDQLLHSTRAEIRVTAIVAGLTLVFLLGRPLIQTHMHALAETWASYEERTERKRLRAIGEETAEHVPEDEKIYVWSYDVGVYEFADRRPAVRFTYPKSTVQLEEIIAALEAGEAHAILWPRRGSSYFEEWTNDVIQTRLQALMDEYPVATSVEGYDIRVRASAP